jgi:putative YhbY family RNA-binding protein
MKKYIRDSKMRAKLKGAAMDMDPTFSIGKDSLTPDFVKAVSEYIRKHELVKVSVLKNCDDDPKELAYTLAGRSESEVVQVIGRKIVLYKPDPDFKKRKYEMTKEEEQKIKAEKAKASQKKRKTELRIVEEADEEYDNV